jgi:hypothetical protein
MKTKIILAIFGVALVAAALVGVSAAQYVGTQNTTNPNLTQRYHHAHSTLRFRHTASTPQPANHTATLMAPMQATAITATTPTATAKTAAVTATEPKHKTKTRTNMAGA